MSADFEAAKQQFISNYIDIYVMPRMRNGEEARKDLDFFRSSPHFGKDHYVRFLETYDRLMRLVDLSGKKIGEAGHLSAISGYLKEQGHDVEAIEGDFRYQMSAESGRFDLLLCLEVLEHIKDQNSDNMNDVVLTNFSGARAFFSEMNRVLRTDGLLLLTTPNPNSLVVAYRAIHNEAPWVFEPHVREYTISHVTRWLRRQDLN